MTADNHKAKLADGAESAPDAIRRRLAGQVAHSFIDSKLTPLVIVAALLLGAFAILQTPREEEPQIVVPMLDVFVQMPGASSQEVAQRVSLPMEKLLREVPGVEYIYSISHPGTTSFTPILTVFRRVFRRRSSRFAPLTTFRSWRSRFGGRATTRTGCAVLPVRWKTR
jgi:hypothetical protein